MITRIDGSVEMLLCKLKTEKNIQHKKPQSLDVE